MTLMPIDVSALLEARSPRFRRSGSATIVLILSLVFACVLAPDIAAQESSDVAQDPWLMGASIGVPGEGTSPAADLMTLALQAVRVEPGRLGAEVAAGISPRFLFSGVLGVGARAGLVLPVELSKRALLLPSVGTGLIGAFGGSTGGVIPGLNAGASVVAFGQGATAYRAGVTLHRLQDSRSTLWLFEFGFLR